MPRSFDLHVPAHLPPCTLLLHLALLLALHGLLLLFKLRAWHSFGVVASAGWKAHFYCVNLNIWF